MLVPPSFLQANPEQPIFKQIQNYVFKFSDLIGQGNFSKVYKGKNKLTSQVVAIKIVELESLKSKKLQELLFSEIDVLKNLNHPNILQCFEVFTSNRNCYIITELCNQGDLESRLRKEGPFDQYKLESIVRDIYEGLCYLAEKNVIHRDLKVANVFLHKGRAKLADFGFAKFTIDKFKDINIGSPIYMSPEGFIHNIYGPKTDVWAFGVLIYQLLHGQTPFASCRTESDLKFHLSLPLTRNKLKSSISNDLKDVILRCMEVDEAKRITILQLASMYYFQRIMGNNKIFGPIIERPPNYSYLQETEVLHSTNLDSRSRLSPHWTPQGAIQNAYRIEHHRAPSPMIGMPAVRDHLSNTSQGIKDKRGISTDKTPVNTKRQIDREEGKGVTLSEAIIRKELHGNWKILSSKLYFKECVNILHYCRLIFKFILTLKLSEASKDNELFKLSKWLIEVLEQINEKIQRKQVIYEGQSAKLREQKLKEVLSEYDKKYKKELSEYIRNQPIFGENKFSLDFMHDFCYTLYLKYDELIAKDHKKTSLALGHSIIMICDSTKLLKKCFQDQDYSPFVNYKQIETLLSLPKESIDYASYTNYNKKMMNYV